MFQTVPCLSPSSSAGLGLHCLFAGCVAWSKYLHHLSRVKWSKDSYFRVAVGIPSVKAQSAAAQCPLPGQGSAFVVVGDEQLGTRAGVRTAAWQQQTSIAALGRVLLSVLPVLALPLHGCLLGASHTLTVREGTLGLPSFATKLLCVSGQLSCPLGSDFPICRSPQPQPLSSGGAGRAAV